MFSLTNHLYIRKEGSNNVKLYLKKKVIKIERKELMKKTLLIVLTAILLLSFTSVRAESNKKIYFTNMNGVELTEQQYNNLLEGFSPDTINTMSAEMINPLKNDTNIQKNTTTKYVKVITEYKNGEAINSIQEEVSKLEYDASPEIDSIIVATKGTKFIGTDYVETNYKKITLEITFGASVSTKYVTLTNVWKQIPKVKSFDVLALAPGVASASFNFNGHRSGYQKWDGNTINYSASSGNWKIVNGSGIWKKGLGLSQNIVDDTTTSLENSITVVFLCGAIPFSARATYQHAVSTVTLAQSQNYTMSSSGMGGLLNYGSNIASKYDNTPGLEAELDL